MFHYLPSARSENAPYQYIYEMTYMASLGRRRRAGALANHNFRAEAPRFGAPPAEQLEHRLHRGDAQAKFRLADGGQRDPEMFADQNVAEPGDREVLRNAQALVQEHRGRANGHEIIYGLYGSGLGSFLQQLQRGLLAF